MTDAPLLDAVKNYLSAGQDLRAIQRRVYLLFLGLVALGTGAYLVVPMPLLTEAQATLVNLIVPIGLAVAVLGFVALWRFPGTLRVIELVMWGANAALVLGSFAIGLTLAETEAQMQTVLGSLALWSPIAIILGFLVFGSRGGLWAATVYLLSAMAVVSPVIADDWRLGSGPATMVEALEYLFAAVVLVALVHAFAKVVERQTGARVAAETVAGYAYTDVLTGLPNRLALNAALERGISLAERQGSRLAVYFIDLDGFKQVNDEHGHQAGDLLLREVGRRLQGSLRRSDQVARISGDEFTVLSFLTGDEEVGALADRLLAAFEAPFDLGPAVVEVGASIGISLFPQDAGSADELLLHADAAMYKAKAAGRRRWKAYTAGEERDHLAELDLGDALRKAIEQDDLHLAYQPFFDLQDGRLVGVEALARWQHPELGEVPPVVFLAQAERHQLGAALGDHLLLRACAQAKAWVGPGMPELRVSVNLAPDQFAAPGFVARVREVLDQTGLPADRLELELTEGMAAQPWANERLEALRAMGVKVFLDDFGTGYSSLMQLRGLAVDGLKIDRSFLSDLRSPRQVQRNALTVLEGIVHLANSLGMTVTAEGVETEAQAAMVRSTGVELGQGFLFARPMGVEALERLLREQADAEAGGEG